MNVYIDGSYAVTGTKIRGGLGICFYNTDISNLSISIIKKGEDIENFDNQATEAMAMFVALWLTEKCGGVTIYSDSQHTVNCLTEWYDKFENNGWWTLKRRPIAQRDILRRCGKMIQYRSRSNCTVQIIKVQAHSGIPGNTRADQCAYSALMCSLPGEDARRIKLKFKTDIGNSVAMNAELKDIKSTITSLYNSTLTRVHSDYSVMPIKSVFKKSRVDIPGMTADELVDMDIEPIKPVEESPAFVESAVVVSEEYPMTPDVDADNSSGTEDKNTINTLLSEGNYLFFPCIQHGGMIVVRYPISNTCKVKKYFKINSISTVAFTTCKDCILRNKSSDDSKSMIDAAIKRSRYIEELCIVPTIFKGSAVYQCAEAISEREPTILTEGGNMRYVPVNDITKVCNYECTVSSIDVPSQKVLPYLTFGFI